MKRATTVLVALALALAFGSVAALAQHGRGGGPPAGVGPGLSHDPSVTHGPSATPGSDPSAGKKSVSDLLTQNTKLASKIHDLTGMDAQQACSGFKNVGQCVAAAHVSKNLGIDFSALRGKMTDPGAESLGKAIHELDPKANAKAEANKGQKQAQNDLNDSGS